MPTDFEHKYAQALKPFLPQESLEYVVNLIIHHQVHFKVSKPRKSKLGDYRIPHQGQGHRISVNGDLNQYSFLITTIHEFAHLVTFKEYGRQVMSHGNEWKQTFKVLFQPLFEIDFLPNDVTLALTNYFKNTPASSCTDDRLYRVLKRYDTKTENVTLVEHLPIHSIFELNGKIFVKGKKLRKYYLCQELNTTKSYRVLGLAEVKQKHINDK